MVLDGRTGFICRDTHPGTLADKLAVLLDDPAMRKRMGQEGKAHFSAHYTRMAFENRLLSILDE